MNKIVISAVITPTSPINISEPRGAYYNPATGQALYGQNKKPGAGFFPMQTTAEMPICLAGSTEEGGNGGRQLRIPYVSGNTLRGALRRKGAKRLFAELEKRGELLKMDLYHVIMCGAATASPDGSNNVVESAKAARHPFVGLFGGGPKLVWSGLRVGNAVPITKNTITVCDIPAGLADQIASGPLTAPFMRTRKDDIKGGSGYVPAIIENIGEEVNKWLGRLAESKVKRDSGKEEDSDSGQVGLSTVFITEGIVIGVPLHSHIEVDTDLPGEAAFGLFVIALADFANDQRLGGCARMGFGRFRLSVTGKNGNGEQFDVLTAIDGRYQPAANDRVTRAVAAWNEAAKGITAAQLKEVFSL